MSGTDNYEFMKSEIVQGIDKYSPYTSKQWNYVNDINSGVYTNSSLSLVQFDLSSIYNSTKFTDTSDLFITIPITMVAAFSTAAGALVAPPATTCNYALCSMLTNYCNLVHQCDIVVNGVVVEQVQPYLNKFVDFKMLSEMSQNDLKSIGPSLGFSDNIDNPNSVVWNNVGASTTSQNVSGNGICNNVPLSQSTSTGFQYQTRMAAQQNAGCVNYALSQRVASIVDTTATGNAFNKIYGTTNASIMNTTQLNAEFKPYFTINGNYLIWYDVAVIRLKDLFDSMNNFGLTKRWDSVIRLYLNTGAISVNVITPDATTLGYYCSATNSTFTNTCPMTINHLPGTSATGGIPANTANIVAGCFISRPPTTNLGGGVNLGGSNASHPMTSCRCYYSQIELRPQIALKYIEENRNKKVVYRSILTSQYNNITGGSSFSQLVQSGVKSPVGVLILPYISSSLNTMGGLSSWGSPFDTNLAHPISITNLQIVCGGQNQLQNTLHFTYENFLEQVNLFESLSSSDLGISVGLISKQFWEINRCYFVNISRSNIADQLSPRNIQISFNNNCNQPIDILVFVIYLDDVQVDVETGLVSRV